MIFFILLASLLWFVMAITALNFALQYASRETTTKVIPPDNCSRQGVRQAWIFDVGQPTYCPGLSNDMLVQDNHLYQRDIVRDERCCYFGNLLEPVQQPFIYIGQSDRVFTETEINQKPYLVNNFSYTNYCPICNQNTIQLQNVTGNDYFVQNKANMFARIENGRVIEVRNGNLLEATIVNGILVVAGNASSLARDIVSINARQVGFQPLPLP